MRRGESQAFDEYRRCPWVRRSPGFEGSPIDALEGVFRPSERRLREVHDIYHFDDDRSWNRNRRSPADKERSTDSMDLGYRLDVRRRRALRDYKDDDLSYWAIIPETDNIAETQIRRRSRQSWRPARAELLGSIGEFHSRRRTAQFYPTQMSANHSRIHGNSSLIDEFYFGYFDGDSQIDEYLTWEQKLEESFDYLRISERKQVRFVISKFIGLAKSWWNLINHARYLEGRREIRTWAKMKRLLREQFLSSDSVELSRGEDIYAFYESKEAEDASIKEIIVDTSEEEPSSLWDSTKISFSKESTKTIEPSSNVSVVNARSEVFGYTSYEVKSPKGAKRSSIIITLEDALQESSEAVIFSESIIKKIEVHRASLSTATIDLLSSPKGRLLELISEKAGNLTLVDLPGLTKVVVEGQSDSIVQDRESMVHSYVEKSDSIILAISPANQDIASSDAIKLAMEVALQVKERLEF